MKPFLALHFTRLYFTKNKPKLYYYNTFNHKYDAPQPFIQITTAVDSFNVLDTPFLNPVVASRIVALLPLEQQKR